MGLFYRIFEHLLPKARAWRLKSNKLLTDLFQGLTGLGSDARQFVDDVYLDEFPESTRELDAWELQFGLPDTGLLEQARRDRLDATWKALGGQDPRYIEDTLRAAGFDVYVHEWWIPDELLHPGYGMGCGSEVAYCGNLDAVCGGDIDPEAIRAPVARNPRTFLRDGDTVDGYLVSCGTADAVCGADALLIPSGIACGELDAVCGGLDAVCGLTTTSYSSVCGARTAPEGYILVNIIKQAVLSVLGCGDQDAFCSPETSCGAEVRGEATLPYTIPDGVQFWPYFLYIGGENFPDIAAVQGSRREEFETLCLQLCPTQQWLGILVNYQ